MANVSELPATDALRALAAAREVVYGRGRIECEDGTVRDVWPVGMTRERGEALRELVVRERAVRCVETGFAYGLSATYLLEGSLRVEPSEGANGQTRVVSIDPFETKQWRGAGRRLIRDAGCARLHELIEEPSEAALPALLALGERFDLAFVDGDHRFEHVFADVFYCRRLVGAGRLIVVDDAWMPAVRKAAAFFESAGLCVREPVPEGSALGKFVVLRVDERGDGREWNEFTEF